MFEQHKGTVKKLGSTLLMCSALTAGIAHADTASNVSAQEAPEVGHIHWNWWQDQSSTQQIPGCGDCDKASVETAPEIGHVGWSWWSQQTLNTQELRNPLSAASDDRELSSELGHVSWQWWTSERSTSQG